ncbi:hypothetical protein [Evansella clarkii]|nr:hypothetical protein [Evansella clarkii]
MKKFIAKVLVVAALGFVFSGVSLDDSASKLGDMPRPHSTFELM